MTSRGLIIIKRLPITMNKRNVKIKEMVIKIISSLVLILSMCNLWYNVNNFSMK